MQVVIDIDKEDYEKIRETSFVENTEIMLKQSSEDRKGTMMLFRVIDAIKKGTPLPKGHGRLIEEERVLDEIRHMDNCGCVTRSINHIIDDIRTVPTVIEADGIIIINASDIKPDDEWMQENEWDEIYKQEDNLPDINVGKIKESEE